MIKTAAAEIASLRIASECLAFDEANDCVVRALAAVSGLSYADSHALAAMWGRKPRQGTYYALHFFSLLGAVPVFGEWFRVSALTGGKTIRQLQESGQHTQGNPRTVRTLLRDSRFRTGRFLVFVKGHVFALVNGEIIGDWVGQNRLLRIEAVMDASGVQA